MQYRKKPTNGVRLSLRSSEICENFMINENFTFFTFFIHSKHKKIRKGNLFFITYTIYGYSGEQRQRISLSHTYFSCIFEHRFSWVQDYWHCKIRLSMTRITCLTVILIFDFVRKVNCLNFNDMFSRPMWQTKTFNTNFDTWYIITIRYFGIR